MTDNDTQIREKLRQFITSELIRNPRYPLKNDEAIISKGLIDSFSLVEVQLFIEEQFGLAIPDPEMTVKTMDTLDQMVARVLRG